MLVILRVHILADVTSHFTPTSVGFYTLDEHCMRDRDWIPLESIHYCFAICKCFCDKLSLWYTFLCIFYMQKDLLIYLL
jgi:hypothetical protein